MAELEIAFFGRYTCTLHGKPIDEFVYDKVRALLAFLAVESDRPHRREYLAGLLWPDQPEEAARKSLRQALSKLRQAIHDHTAKPAFLVIQHDTIQFNCRSSHTLDVHQFLELMAEIFPQHGSKQFPPSTSKPNVPSAESKIQSLLLAIDLYQGDFLEGFYLRNTPEFENWWLIERARLREKYLECLRELGEQHAALENYPEAISTMRRFIELEPWHEEAHRQLMTWLTLNGQRTNALTQYERLRQILADELEIEPTQSTTDLFQRIRAGALQNEPRSGSPGPTSQPRLPAFLEASNDPNAAPQAPFVAREAQLRRLRGFLEAALNGRGQVVFVSSEAGWGKTSLLANFARQAQEKNPDLIVVSGVCTTYQGAGDPYLPFREILRTLTGDIEGKWTAGAITGDAARRLWELLPKIYQILLKHGPNLIDAFVPYEALIRKAQAHSAFSAELIQQLISVTSHQQKTGVNQERILEEYTEVLSVLSKEAPLLLILDDLHWADASSINLLYNLGRRLINSPVMILGAYRPEDIATGREGKEHSLAAVLHEFKSQFGNIWLHLDEGGFEEGRQFVDALLDLEPNQLSAEFRDQLTRNTRGRPLFTTEMLLDMQERGDVQQDELGRWVDRANITWDALPERVEGVIENRINRLDPGLREILRTACVEGEEFTAELLAQVLEIDLANMIRMLSIELAGEHKLIRAQGVIQEGNKRFSRYQFSHILFQKYLYSTLDPIVRVHQHGAISNALLKQYEGNTEKIAGRLAWHFQEAGDYLMAIEYSQQAGEAAARVHAYPEAIKHFEQTILLARQIHSEDERLSMLYIRLGRLRELASSFDQALLTYEEMAGLALEKRNLAMELASLIARITILSFPNAVHDPEKALSLGERALFLAIELADPEAEAKILWSSAIANFFLYHLKKAIVFGERSLALARQHTLVEQTAQTLNDIGGLIYLYSGRLNQARQALEEASDLWRELGNTPMLTDSLSGSCITHVYTGDFDQAIAFSQQAYQLSLSSKNLWGQSYSLWTIGDAYAERGEYSQAIRAMEECIAMGKQAGFLVSQSYTPMKLAQVYLELGMYAPAIQLAEQAVNLSQEQVPAHAALGRSVLARLHLRTGKLSEAIAQIETAKHDPYQDSWVVFFLSVPLVEAELAMTENRLNLAAAILDDLVERLQNFGMRLLLPEALYLQGKVLQLMQQDRLAFSKFLEARAEAEAINSRRTIWRILAALSQLEKDPSLASQRRKEARAVIEWISTHFEPQHTHLREAFLSQADVQTVMAESQGQ